MPPEVAACLDSGEEVLWSGQPRPYVFILRGLPNIAFGVTWGVLGAFWYRGAGGIGQYSAFEGWWKLVPIFSFPFILAGFSFFLRPIRLGQQARRTWYVVTNRRVFRAELFSRKPPVVRVFTPEEMGPPQVIKRPFDRLDDVILTRRAQENSHLTPGLDAGFFGIETGQAAAAAINRTTNP